MSIKLRVVAGAISLAGTGNLVPATPAMAAPARTVNYAVVSRWPTGFQASAAGDQPPTVTLTSPPANPDIAWGYDVRLAASAGDTDGVVTKVEFYGNGTLLATDTTAPYEVTYTARDAPGGLSLSAKAYDDGGLTATSQAVSAFVFAPAETLTGVVEAGAAGGCWLLATGTTQYLLLSDDRSLFVPGARLRVRGTTRPNLTTTCVQGTPFLVYSAQPA